MGRKEILNYPRRTFDLKGTDMPRGTGMGLRKRDFHDELYIRAVVAKENGAVLEYKYTAEHVIYPLLGLRKGVKACSFP